MLNKLNYDEPIFTISAAAKLLKISVHTLRMYEREGLFISYKKESNQRLYSNQDVERIECIRRAINEMKISINGIKTMYSLIPCWDIVKCSEKDRQNCNAFMEHSKPCWTYKHKNNVCEKLNCRECSVYQNFTRCDHIKDAIKLITVNK